MRSGRNKELKLRIDQTRILGTSQVAGGLANLLGVVHLGVAALITVAEGTRAEGTGAEGVAEGLLAGEGAEVGLVPEEAGAGQVQEVAGAAPEAGDDVVNTLTMLLMHSLCTHYRYHLSLILCSFFLSTLFLLEGSDLCFLTD